MAKEFNAETLVNKIVEIYNKQARVLEEFEAGVEKDIKVIDHLLGSIDERGLKFTAEQVARVEAAANRIEEIANRLF